jgi:hypothetical protein
MTNQDLRNTHLGVQVAEHARRKSIQDAWEWEGPEEKRAEAIAEAVKAETAYEVGKRIASKMAFKTKDSGARTTYDTGMQRDVTTGKPRWDLVAPEGVPLESTMGYRHAMLMARGAEKYGDRNWEKARTDAELARFKQSAYRHFMQWYHGELDEDHASAVYFNIAGAEFVQCMRKGES